MESIFSESAPQIKALVRNLGAFSTLFAPGKSWDNLRYTATPYTESRLTRSVANERVGFPVVEQLVSSTPVAKLPLVSMTPAENLPLVSTTPAANFATSSACVVDAGGKLPPVCHRYQLHRWQIMGTISCCRHLKVNLKAKIFIYVNSSTQRCPNKIIKIFLMEDFSICNRCQYM
jgi:hypothetical protein